MSECIVCKNNKKFKDKFEILKQCLKCKHVFADINLSKNEIDKIYSNDYFFGKEYINYINDKKQIIKNSLIRMKEIRKYIINFRIKNIFEIGCAYGFFLNTVRDNFNEISGVDVNKDAINYAKNRYKLNVTNHDFLKLKNKDINNFNIYCMFDVIEHLNNPDEYIKKINENSPDETLLFITTGDIDSLNAKINRKNWRLIHPPSHIHYFSKKSIKFLLEKNGFNVLSISYCGYYRNLSFIFNKIEFIKKYFQFILKILNYFKILNLDIYLNLYDIMFVVAKKKNNSL